MIVSLVQITAIRDDIREIRSDIKPLTGKVYDTIFLDYYIGILQLWERNKESFASGNGSRHSYAVDAVTRKEGKAAILWIGQALGEDTK